MNVSIKMTGQLYDEILRDLERPHPFAFERIGFVFGKIGTASEEGKLVLLTRYHAIPDGHYIDDPTVGARIGPDAMTWAMQAVYHGRAAREGIFHIHMHACPGETGMSRTDAREVPPMIPGFQSVGRDAAHGIIILSLDHGSGWVRLPGSKDLVSCTSMSVIGTPVSVFDRGRAS
jgi:hypothetical protein